MPQRLLIESLGVWVKVRCRWRIVEISTIKCQDFAFRVAWFGIIFRGFGYLVLGTC